MYGNDECQNYEEVNEKVQRVDWKVRKFIFERWKRLSVLIQ